jgi:hypothetical protein
MLLQICYFCSTVALLRLMMLIVLPFEYGVLVAGLDFWVRVVNPQQAGTKGGGRIPRMLQQPDPTSPPLASNLAHAPGSATGPTPVLRLAQQRPAPPRPENDRIPPWLVSAELFLRVLLKIYVGMLFVYAPWSGQVLTFLPGSRYLWEQNQLFVWFPALGVYAANGAVRGLVSGLGVLNLWLAFQDVLRRRDG